MKKAVIYGIIAAAAVLVTLFIVWIALIIAFPRPYRETVEKSGVKASLVYAVIRTESGYDAEVVSRAGAVGLMQLKPSTAEYICEREGVEFDAERLKEGEYNILLGTKYLIYLTERFHDQETALAAYNAGEGTVGIWLKDDEFSSDGETLIKIPYPETAAYVKKVAKFQKIYEILYP